MCYSEFCKVQGVKKLHAWLYYPKRKNSEFNKMIPARNIADLTVKNSRAMQLKMSGGTHMESRVRVCVCGKKALREINASEQQKLIIYHLAEYIEMEGMGMGLLSEQTGESLHSDLKKHWLRSQVKNENAPSYAKNLYKALVLYNSIHV